MGFRYLTLNAIVRKYTVETTRDGHDVPAWLSPEAADESRLHSPESILGLADLFRKGLPEARLTWAVSWQALIDPSPRYRAVRATLKALHEDAGDDVTAIIGGYFPNRYNTRGQINRDFDDAFAVLKDWLGHVPRAVVTGFLAADNIRHLAERHGVIAVQGNIWSQCRIDNMDGDGSIAYPYYPSRQHFCKPAQGAGDFIDCLNCDGWTVDFHFARRVGCADRHANSRIGIGPIETLGNLGVEEGMRELKATTEAHYGLSHAFNPFSWLTCAYETALFSQMPNLSHVTDWLAWMRARWPDVRCVPLAEMAAEIRAEHPDNETLAYELHQRGSGIGPTRTDEEIVWYMNKAFRLGIFSDAAGKRSVFDYTRYTHDYREPRGPGERDWSLLDAINQKGLRPQDAPVPLEAFGDCMAVRERIRALGQTPLLVHRGRGRHGGR
jgi:hypothetical protein